MTRTLWEVFLGRATFGVETNAAGTVIWVAPIGRWMAGKHINTITRWIRGKGGTIRMVRQIEKDSG